MNAIEKWQLQDAKNRLSEVVRKAREDGPQVITLRGDDAVVVVAAEDYKKLTQRSRGKLADFFQRSPLAGTKLDLTRSRDTGRAVKL